MRIYTIKRLHMRDKESSWKNLSNHLGVNITELDDNSHKAFIKVHKLSKAKLKSKIKDYNKKYNTDFRVI